VESFVRIEDYLGALEVLQHTRALITPTLHKLRCLQAMVRQLEDYEGVIEDIMTGRFVHIAVTWVDINSDEVGVERGPGGRPVADLTASKKDVSNGGEAPDRKDATPTPTDRSTVTTPSEVSTSFAVLVRVLIRCQRLLPAVTAYKAKLSDSIRLAIRTCVLEYLTDFDASLGNPLDDMNVSDTSAESTPFGQRVKGMTTEHFLSCLSISFEQVRMALERCNSVHGEIESVIREVCRAERVEQQEQRRLTGTDGDAPVTDVPQPRGGEEGGVSLPSVTSESNLMSGVSANKIAHSGNGSSSDPSSPPPPPPSISSQLVDPGAGGGQEVNVEVAELPDHYNEIVKASQSCLQSCCELAQRSLTQLLSLRREQTAKLPLEKMKFLWEISLAFILAIEDLTKASAYVMRQCLLSQGKLFLESLSESLKNKLVSTLDSERWVQCDVSAERQREIDRLTSGRAFLPRSPSTSGGNAGSSSRNSSGSARDLPAGPVDANGNKEMSPLKTLPGPDGGNPTDFSSPSASGTIVSDNGYGPSSQSDSQKRAKKEPTVVIIENTSYRVVWSALYVVEVITTYLDVCVCFSPVATDVLSRIVEILRLFDSRTRQLVLGAQAIQSSARLKSIAAKHLCVTAQSLSLLLALIPHIRAALLAQLPSRQRTLLTEIDRIQQALIDHHAQILSKFVNIVGDFVDASATKLRTVDWDRFQGQCEYFEDVLKNVTALHRVLHSTLPSEQVQDVFYRIFGLLNRKIPQHFEGIMPSTQTGRQRILDEVVHVVNACSMLKQVDASSITLEDTFRARFLSR